MLISIDRNDAKQLKRAMDQLPIRVQQRVMRSATLAGASAVRKEARRRAPIRTPGPKGRVAKPRGNKGSYSKISWPGELRKKIRAKRNLKVPKWMTSYQVGWDITAFWGLFIEKGTSRQAAQPFLRPAFDAKRSEIPKIIGERLWKGIGRELKKLQR